MALIIAWVNVEDTGIPRCHHFSNCFLFKIPKKKFDCILLCNFLHEVNPREWIENFETIKDSLKEDGFLIIIEDKFLPKGEEIPEFGYLIFGTDEFKTLFNQENILELKLKDEKFQERIVFNCFRKEQLEFQLTLLI